MNGLSQDIRNNLASTIHIGKQENRLPISLAKSINRDYDGSSSAFPILQDQLLIERSDGNRTITLLFVSSADIDFTLNWLCYARNLDIKNYVFAATDETVFDYLKSLKEPVFRRELRIVEDGQSMEFNTAPFLQFMLARTQLVYDILQKGYNVLLTDTDTVWLEDPYAFIYGLKDFNDYHLIAAADDNTACGGFLLLKASNQCIRLWKEVLDDFRANPGVNEQAVLYNKLQSSPVKYMLLPPDLFVSGHDFFDLDKLTNFQNGNPFPKVIHNNYIVGHDAKRERFLNFGLWKVQDVQSGMCVIPNQPGSDILPKPESISFTVKVITYDRLDSLKRLLDSLERADYGGDTIFVEIFVDHPNTMTSSSLQMKHKIWNLVNNWKFSHGTKRVHIRNSNAGLSGQWFEIWTPCDYNEVALAVEDDIELSPFWYKWLKHAVNTYYSDSNNFDPRLFGISLQNQRLMPANPGQELNVVNDNLPFKYQLIGTWGQLFFPWHWSNFVKWFDERRFNTSYEPRFSNLVISEWYKADKAAGKNGHWEFYFVAWVAEMGFYNLYTNFDEHRALSINHQEKGVHFTGDSGGADRELLHAPHWKETYMDLPPATELLLFDFHMNRIDNPAILEHRTFAIKGLFPKIK